MKKIFLKLIAYLFVAIVCVGFASCGDDENDETSSPDIPINPVEPSKNDAMSSAEQKEYLEKVALDFMDMMPASDFRDISELGKFINENYINDYNWDDVKDWAKDAFEAAREALGTKTIESETERWGSHTYKYNYIYTNYKAILFASNFTGHFTARNGRWVHERANDLQFIFNDKRGQQCIIKMETSGTVKKAYLLNVDDWKGYDYDSNDYYEYNDYFDRTQCTIGVPEKTIVTLTQDGNQVIKTTVKIDLGGITNEEFDISKSNLTFSALVEINNGYKFDVSKVAYTANTNASMAFTMSKNGTAIVAIGVSAEVCDIPSVNVSAFFSECFNEDNYDFDKVNGKKAYVKLDILGKVQIQGSMSDIRKFVEYLTEASDNDTSESAYKSYINQANALADINLFYDGKNVKQAAIKLEAFVDETWNGRTYWEVEPIIYFYDGSSYSTFEAFFNEKDFKKVIDTFKTLTNEYANLVDERIDW